MDTTGNFGLNAHLTFFSRLLHVVFLATALIFSLSAMADISGGKSTFLGGGNEDQVLPPDEAFKLSVVAKDAQTI